MASRFVRSHTHRSSARLHAAVLGTSCLFAAANLIEAAHAGALPGHGHYVDGHGTIGKANQSLTVKQSSTTGIINWNSFSIGAKNSVKFDNGSGATLNRVTGGNLSTIAGSLHATGSLYLMNSQGVIVSGSGKVVTGGSFVATTGPTLNDERFKDLRANVVNRGSIIAGGNVSLNGANVRDAGTIRASRVDLDARNKLTVDGAIAARNANGSGGTVVATGRHIDVKGNTSISANGTTGGTVLIGGDIHGGAIQKDNFVGQDVRTAQTTKIAAGATISADASKGAGGNIVIWSDGHTTFGGRISAQGNTRGGFSEVSSHDLLGFTGGVDLTALHGTTGTLLLDPENVTITGGVTTNGALTSGVFTPSGDDSVLNVETLETALQTASVKITTGATGAQSGDITVLVPIAWSSNHTLTLDAFHSVIVGANINVQGGGAVVIDTNDGGSGGTFSFANGAWIDYGPVNNGGKFVVNGTNYKLIYTMAQLQGLNSNLTGDYALATSLDGSTTSGWVPLGMDSTGTILNSGQGFSGIFEGLGNTVSGLKIDETGEDRVGFFGYASGLIRDFGVIGGSVKGGQETGALVGDLEGTLANVFAIGTAVTGASYTGGLVGYADTATAISQSFATGDVTAAGAYTGGLIGDNHGTITTSYATGTVTGTGTIGGFVGYNQGTISKSYATGDVHDSGTISGGFVGENASGGTMSEAYESGTATGSTNVGGFVGLNDNGGDLGTGPAVVWNATNNATFAGTNSGNSASIALTTGAMMNEGSYTGWTFGTTPGAVGWVIVDSNGSLNNAGSVAGGTTPMLLSEYTTNIAAPHQLQLMELALAGNYNVASAIDMSGTAGGDVWGSGGFIAVGGNTAGANFTGSFSGNNNIISHLTIDDTTNTQVGLFGELDGSVDGIKLSNASITATVGAAKIGVLAGDSDGTINGATSSGILSDNAGATAAGGLVGQNAGKINSSASTTAVTDTVGTINNIGGLTGINTGLIFNSWASGAVTGVSLDNDGGLAGFNSGIVENSHATGNVTVTSGGNSFNGGLVGEDTTGGLIESSYATGKVIGFTGSEDGGLVGASISDTILDSYATGSVTSFDSKVGGLIGVDTDGNVYGSHATGKVTDTYVSGTANYAGGLIGYVNTTTQSQIADSYATGAVISTGPAATAGGLIGYVTKTEITSSYATGNVSATGAASTGAYGGGLIGEANTSVVVSDSHATGKVTTDNLSDAGGLIGYSVTTNLIDNDYASGAVAGNLAGGLIGASATGNTIINSHASGDVTGLPNATSGADDVGGLIGTSASDAAIEADYATGDVNGGYIAGLNYAGGLIGAIGGTETVRSSYATGSVSDAIDIGGLVGVSGVSILDSYATGDVTGATGANIGGLVGQNSGAISYSYATGNVNGPAGSNPWAGGLVGWGVGGSIDHSFATGNVSVVGTAPAAGGLVGENAGAVSYSYATGSVTGDGTATGAGKFGGLLGANTATVNQAYALGDVSNTAAGLVGGLIGFGTGNVTSGYWDTQTTGQTASAGGVGLTTAQLQAGLPKGFSSSEWGTVAGTTFPYLSWQFAGGTPQVISGTISGAGNTGVDVGVLVNGVVVTPVVTMSSGANGYYYELLAPGTIASSGKNVLVFETSGANHGDAFIENAKGSLANINLAANTLVVDGTASSETSLLTAMESALGTAHGAAFLYTSAGAFTSGIDLDMNLSASSFNLNQSINIGTGDLTIDAAGSISEASADAIIAQSLAGSSVGTAAFVSTTNVIADLGSFTTGGNNNFALEDNADLTTTGTVNAGTSAVKLTTTGGGHDINVNGKLAGGSVQLNSAATIGESSAGKIVATTLTGSSGGATALTAGTNTLTDLGAFTSGGAFALTDAHALTLNGTLNAGTNNVSLTTTGSGHDLAIDANLKGGTVNLATTGEATESSTAAITANKINVTAHTGILLTSTHNNITTLGTHTTNSGPNKVTL